jgi:phage terminase small subunit
MGADKKKLTVKQERFAQGLFAGLTQREAYKQAYDCQNMMDKHIDEEACILAANPKVSQRIDQLTEELKYRNMATVEKVLAEYAKIGFADIKDYLEYKTAKTVVDYDVETGNPIFDYRQIVDTIDSAQVDGSVIQEISISKDGTFKFKLHDKKGALDMIGKHLGMFTEKVELSGHNGGPLQVIDTSGLPPEALDAIVVAKDMAEIREIVSRYKK